MHSIAAGKLLAADLPTAIYQQADVADEQQCQTLVDAAIAKWGRLDILVNNAAYRPTRIPYEQLDLLSDEMFLNNYKVNVLGAWYLARIALPHLATADNGVIINISSISGLRAIGSSIPYAVSKAALNHLTKCLAKAAGTKARVNAIAPGFIETPRTAAADMQKMREPFREKTALKRLGQPQDIAETVLSIINARYLTGEIITVDGGSLLE